MPPTTTATKGVEAYVASNSLDWVEIRVRGCPRTPTVQAATRRTTTEPIKHDQGDVDAAVLLPFDVQRASVAGTWRCILINPPMGTDLVVQISSSSGVQSLQSIELRTMDTADLGRHRLRLGILSDPHVNLYGKSSNGKRLYGSANFLLEKYATKLAKEHKVDRIVLPGDICDSGSTQELKIAANILDGVRKTTQGRVPIHVVIGNHESNLQKFNEILVPECQQDPTKGYYSISNKDCGVHMILLATNQQDSLNEEKPQLEWLRQNLQQAAATGGLDIILVFLHYSLLLHPLHNKGQWDDGLQLLDNANGVLQILHQYKHMVRAVICGHKNVPSAVVDDQGLLHTLSPQLIQVPCGYDVIDIYDNGLIRVTHEIDEIELQDCSRQHAGKLDAQQRWGKPEHRSLRHVWR